MGLAVQRQMNPIFADNDVGHSRLGWQTAFDQPWFGMGLRIAGLTGSAGMFWTVRDTDTELRRIKPRCTIFDGWPFEGVLL